MTIASFGFDLRASEDTFTVEQPQHETESSLRRIGKLLRKSPREEDRCSLRSEMLPANNFFGFLLKELRPSVTPF